MSLWMHILLFLPLNWVICIVSSALQRDTVADILRHGSRVFLWLSATVIAASALVFFVMEWILDR